MTKPRTFFCFVIIYLISGIKDTSAKPPKLDHFNEVDIEEFPWQVTLISSSEYGGLPCGGSIISKRHILTAALCSYFEPMDTIYVYLGSSIFEEGLEYKLSSIHNHPNFTTNFPFPGNIAVLELDGEIEFDEKKSPIKLPEKDVPLNTRVTVTGFGLEAWNEYPNHLKKQDLKIVGNEICDAAIANASSSEKLGFLNSAQACGAPVFISPLCQANMGGAVVWENTVVGITTWAISCNDETPEIITRVYKYLDWIQGIIGDQN